MKHLIRPIILALAAVAFTATAAAQVQRVMHSAYHTYDTREAATASATPSGARYIAFKPTAEGNRGGMDIYSQSVELPAMWNDSEVYLHIENTADKAYALIVNGELQLLQEDNRTPSDYLLSPALHQGTNTITLALHTSAFEELHSGIHSAGRMLFEGCYIYARHKIHIEDVLYHIRPDQNGTTWLYVEAIVKNAFAVEEPASIGYDIYSPDGKLQDYGVRDITIAGKTSDTLRIDVKLPDAARQRWSSENPALYALTLFAKRDGKPREYMPFKVGYTTYGIGEQAITAFGSALKISFKTYVAPTTRKEFAAQVRQLKAQRINTLRIDAPQPLWFYDECDRQGLYVIESANIAPTRDADERRRGGTPSNDPKLAGEYRTRCEAMYRRTRNHPSVIAYSIGGAQSGNGYNMYEAYRLLKSLEDERAVICPSAGDEWNTDITLK